MCARADARVAFGKPLAEQGVVRDWIAESRVRVEQLRLLLLKAAWLMDTADKKAAPRDPGDQDRHAEYRRVDPRPGHPGARCGRAESGRPAREGVRCDRTLRFVDAPDEVHEHAPAGAKLSRQRKRREP
jgi:acyl-CoA dehydrogenase